MALSDIFRQALADLTDDRWRQVVGLALRRCQHFPVPAELCELADEVGEAEQDATIRRRMEAEGQRVMRFPGPMPQLPAAVESPEIEAERQRKWAENRERVKAEIAAATANMRAPGSGATRRPAAAISEQDRAEAEAWLQKIKAGGS